MRKTLILTFLFTFGLLGCKISGTAPVTIEVEECAHGTVVADKTQLDCGELLTLTVTPDDGYYTDSVWPEEAFQDIEDKNKYYWIVEVKEKNTSDKENPVQKVGASFLKYNQAPQYDVHIQVPEGTGKIEIADSKTSFFEDDVVTFSLTVNKGYQLLEDGLTVYTVKDDLIEFTESEDTPGTYSFVMPHNTVFIKADIVTGLYLISKGELYIKHGNTTTISLINTTKYNTFDAYYGPEHSLTAIKCGSDLQISDGATRFDTDGLEIGTYMFWLDNNLGVKSNKIKIRVGYADCDSSWTSVKIQMATPLNDLVKIRLDQEIPRAMVKYSYSDDPTERELIVTGDYKEAIFSLPFSRGAVARDVTFQIYDPVLKIRSDVKTVTLEAKTE